MASKGENSSHISDMEFLKNSRRYYRQKLTRTHAFIGENIGNMTLQGKLEYLEEIKTIRIRLTKMNDHISDVFRKIKYEITDLEEELEQCDLYDSRCVSAIQVLEIANIPVASVDVPSGSGAHGGGNAAAGVSTSNNLRLPMLPLPKFSNKSDENYDSFMDTFEGILDKYNLSQLEKYMYLEGQLSGEALILVKSLSRENRSFDSAKNLLKQAFSSPTKQKFQLIKQMIDLCLDFNDNPYRFISEVNTISDQIVKLNLDIDTVFQYCIWTGLNDEFKKALITITNKNQPSLKEITDNLFNATDRYALNVKAQRSDFKSVDCTSLAGMATNINYKAKTKFKPCILCASSTDSVETVDHPIFQCKRFISSESKINQLKKIKACIKCANDNHMSHNCEFRFRRNCSHCNKLHFDFLCFKNSNKYTQNSDNTDKREHSQILSGSVSINTSNLSFNVMKSSIIPTFTFTTPKGRVLRAMKDSGSQASFILTDVAIREKFPVIVKDVSINVNGFNSTRKCTTNIVKVTGKFASVSHDVLAICIPEITTSISLSGLSSLAREFSDKCGTLADCMLPNCNDSIDNLSFILGCNASYIVPMREIVLGNDIKTSYFDTPIGFILAGPVELMRKNLKFFCGSTLENPITNPHRPNDVDMGDNSSINDLSIDINHIVLDGQGKLIKDKLDFVANEMVNFQDRPLSFYKCSELFESDTLADDTETFENKKIVANVLDNTTRSEDGRLIMPLMWNESVKPFLSQNLSLARQILLANLRKLKKNREQLQMIDDVINSQKIAGIIEPIGNLNLFLNENPNCGFLAHMPIFRYNKETTKCRVVFLSNLAGKDPNKTVSLSNNQCMNSGPCLNSKISTALISLRFDKYLLCFDLVKAFLQVGLSEADQLKLCFLWFRDPLNSDFTLMGYKNVKLSFGLKCSPALLMLALYKILILDVMNDSKEMVELKKLLYNNFYMDNGGFTTNDPNYLKKVYNLLPLIFKPYKFPLQQFCTNESSLQEEIVSDSGSVSSSTVPLLGLLWDIKNDTISTKKLFLCPDAHSKRDILRTIASNFDIYNFNAPLLNRARLFFNKLQIDKTLSWDSKLSKDLLRVWKNICSQLNSAPILNIKRSVGSRSDTYELVAFADSSKFIYGIVIYLYNVNLKKYSFLLAKNRIISAKLRERSIPCLELQALTFGAEVLADTKAELTGGKCVVPVKISNCVLYTDSLVCLSWLRSFSVKLEKLSKPIFVMNRLALIERYCSDCSVNFKFCKGISNPADCMTRELSHKQLLKSNFLTGPGDLEELQDFHEVRLPCHIDASIQVKCSNSSQMVDAEEPVIEVNKYSSFSKLLRVLTLVYKFIGILKFKLKERSNPNCPSKFSSEADQKALSYLVKQEQRRYSREELDYLQIGLQCLKDIPKNVQRFNLFEDDDGIIRVKSKFGRWKTGKFHPIFLSKESCLVKLLILHYHIKTGHGGVYNVLNLLRKSFWIPNVFVNVKKVLKICVNCRRLNQRAFKTNQSAYRDFRADPPNVPFRAIYVDYLGPFLVKHGDAKIKVYILLFSCLWSRYINLKLCLDLSVREFLRAFQLHVFEFGMPEACHSDLGSQIVAGSKIISDFLQDADSKRFFKEQGMDPLRFTQFPKGCKQLGGIVEVCVKQVKRLLFSSLGKNVLKLEDFRFHVCQTVSLVNKRPVVLKEMLRDTSIDVPPSTITPEIIVKGYELPCLNIIPELQSPEVDPGWYNGISNIQSMNDKFNSLTKVRSRLVELYNSEFLKTLIDQATNRDGRYKPVTPDHPRVGDLVLIKEEHTKRIDYPMARIKKVEFNYLNEINELVLLKGKTGEIVRRHPTAVIPLLSVDQDTINNEEPSLFQNVSRRPERTAAVRGAEATRTMVSQGLV